MKQKTTSKESRPRCDLPAHGDFEVGGVPGIILQAFRAGVQGMQLRGIGNRDSSPLVLDTYEIRMAVPRSILDAESGGIIIFFSQVRNHPVLGSCFFHSRGFAFGRTNSYLSYLVRISLVHTRSRARTRGPVFLRILAFLIGPRWRWAEESPLESARNRDISGCGRAPKGTTTFQRVQLLQDLLFDNRRCLRRWNEVHYSIPTSSLICQGHQHSRITSATNLFVRNEAVFESIFAFCN